ncbi:CLIP domain-containing serine protease B4-like [Toxorhynchites rutilus septentrionalis]|uniref:CLIP domain-containing serine protease B4-like n=1 Tax=Toxorhynchites rutilus septentrionalis TaxID=329112 RepID=UPI002478959D|nr:CLIP domain-containing serine protease B4-like [Toxorhynchites rutilus septentrionalis]
MFQYRTSRSREMALLLGLSIALSIIIAGQAVVNGDSCTDGAGLAGTCQLLKNCHPIVDLLQRGNFSEVVRTYLVKSRCGYTTNDMTTVCCPSPRKLKKRLGSKLPTVQVCGRTSANRIFGGDVAGLGDYPWLARIQYMKPNNRFGFHCGGVLINERHVLTAAHCIEIVPASWKIYMVRLGDYDSESDVECSAHDPDDCVQSAQDVFIASYLIHEDYFQENGADYNDIALIRLDRSVNYTEFIQPICLPTTEELKNRDLEGLQLTVAGWGETQHRLASRYQMHVGMPGWNNTRCREAFSGVQVAIRDTQLCAGGVKNQDSCRGDAGGPLMKIEKIDGISAWVLEGIVSFGMKKCGTENVPGVYTRISKYMDWILENI